MTDARVTGAATVFVVTDVARSTAYYRDALGFAVAFEYGAPIYYVCLCRDDVDLHLIDARQTERRAGHGGLCLFVTDVDKLHAELVARGACPITAPEDRPYGMRDFNLRDPDGNHLTFGQACGTAA